MQDRHLAFYFIFSSNEKTFCYACCKSDTKPCHSHNKTQFTPKMKFESGDNRWVRPSQKIGLENNYSYSIQAIEFTQKNKRIKISSNEIPKITPL
ncbi:MAG: hypothetical protein ACFFDN_11200 [Candidatus Hodarchaeota archaeon]